jgi:hypothetical protein
MARTTRTKAEPEVDETANGDRDYSDIADKNPTWQAKAYAQWLKDEAGVTVTAKQVQAVTALRVPFRQSEFYQDAKDEHQADQVGDETPEPEAKPKAKSRSAKATTSPAKGTRTRRSRAGKTAPEVTVAKDETPKRSRTRRSRAQASNEAEPSTTPEAPF